MVFIHLNQLHDMNSGNPIFSHIEKFFLMKTNFFTFTHFAILFSDWFCS